MVYEYCWEIVGSDKQNKNCRSTNLLFLNLSMEADIILCEIAWKKGIQKVGRR